jgi:hypothetical protein
MRIRESPRSRRGKRSAEKETEDTKTGEGLNPGPEEEDKDFLSFFLPSSLRGAILTDLEI